MFAQCTHTINELCGHHMKRLNGPPFVSQLSEFLQLAEWWGKPEQVLVQNMEELYAHDCHQNVTSSLVPQNHNTGTVAKAT